MGADEDDRSEQGQPGAEAAEEAVAAGSPPEVADEGAGSTPAGDDPMEGEAPSG